MNAAAWGEHLGKLAARVREQHKAAARRIALQFYTALFKATPVDTGRLKGNWNMGFGEKDTSLAQDGQFKAIKDLPRAQRESAGLALAERIAAGKIAQARDADFELGDTIYFTNNVNYAKAVDEGDEDRPGQHFVDAALSSMKGRK